MKEKKAYRSPTLVEYGDISRLTLGKTGSIDEINLGQVVIGLCNPSLPYQIACIVP